MLDRSYRWTPEPNWLDAVLRGDQCSVAAIPNCVQIMLSGNIGSGLQAMKINEKGWNDETRRRTLCRQARPHAGARRFPYRRRARR